MLPENEKINFAAAAPFILVHIFALGWLFTEVHTIDIVVCLGLYFGRMFCITGGYHRYFAHRAYKLGRLSQFLLAFGGTLAAQKGPLWWAGLHRHHHRFSDMEEDIHSPKRGFWWSHVGWILCDKYNRTPTEEIEDFAKFPELRILDRFSLLPPTILGVLTYVFLGWSGLFLGFLFSTVMLYHSTFAINSLAHVYGSRRYATRDTSRNNFWLAILTMGEGWHNNHHHYQSCVRQGFFWWEIDLSYYIIRTFEIVGIAWDVKQPPASLLHKNHIADGHLDIGMFEAHLAKANATLTNVRLQVSKYCDERMTQLEDDLQLALNDAKQTWQQWKHQVPAAPEAGRQQDYEEYLQKLLASARELIDQLSEQTLEFCELKARSLERSITYMKMHASDFVESKQLALDEIVVAIRSCSQNFKARANECLDQLQVEFDELHQSAALA